MTHEETSMRTKKALCQSLKELMKHKPFSKITVSELIRNCNVNRKTFYYHFEDIYDLLKWMLEQEAVEVVKQFDLLNNYEDAFLFVIDYVEQNSFFLNCIYDSVGRDELKKRFFYHDFVGIVETIIRNTERKLSLVIDNDFRYFLCNLYTEGIVGITIDLFQHPELYDKEKLTSYLSVMISSSIPAVLAAKGTPASHISIK